MTEYRHTVCGARFDSAAAAVIHLLILRLAKHPATPRVPVRTAQVERPAGGIGVN